MQSRTINADFIGDFSIFCKKELLALNIEVPSMESADIIRAYYNIRFRDIPSIPRKILVSNEFKSPLEYQTGLEILSNRIINGESLRGHLSTRINNVDLTKLEAHDPMLNDWGIHHLHLGTIPYKKNPNFIDRTKAVLFAIFDNQTAYFIGIYNHGPQYYPWVKLQIMEIISSNWPYLLKEANGVIGENLNEKEIKSLRSKNSNYILNLNGHNIFPTGGGSMPVGLSFNVLYQCDQAIAELEFFESVLKNNVDNISIQLEKQLDIKVPRLLNFKLCFNDAKCYLEETNLRLILNTEDFLIDGGPYGLANILFKRY